MVQDRKKPEKLAHWSASEPKGIPADDISSRLRSYYESVQEEAIPDRFLDLLEKLDNVEQAQAGRARE